MVRPSAVVLANGAAAGGSVAGFGGAESARPTRPSGGVPLMLEALRVGRFLRDQKGAVTVEFTVLVLPFIMMLVFFVDASIIYYTHSEMFNVARDIARRMSTEQLETMDEVHDYARERLHLGQRTYFMDAEFGADMTVTIAVPIGDAAIFGAWFEPIIGRELVATSSMRREPRA